MNFEDIYKLNTSIICRNREDSDKFRRFLSLNGVLWGSGADVMDEDNWKDSLDAIRYVFHAYDAGAYRLYYDDSTDCVEYARAQDYLIIEASEINMPEIPDRKFNSSLLMELYR